MPTTPVANKTSVRTTGRGSPLLPAFIGVLAVALTAAAVGSKGPAKIDSSASPAAEQSTADLSAAPSEGASVASTADPGSDGLVVNDHVVYREGVPDDLKGLFWSNDSEVGQLGTTAYLRVPAAERVLFVGQGLVVSTPAAKDNKSGESTIVVREVATGSTHLTASSPILPTNAVIAGDRLFWVGRPPSVEGPADGGVWAVALSGDSAPLQVVPPINDMAAAGFVERGRLIASRTGNTVATVVGNMGRTHYDFIDTRTLTVTASAEDRIIFGISETYAVEAVGGEPPDVFTQIAAVDLQTGKQLWSHNFGPDVELVHVMVTDKNVFADFSDGHAWVLGAISAATGSYSALLETNVETFPYPNAVNLAPQLSTDLHLVLTRETSAADSISAAGGVAIVDVFEVSSGQFLRNAFEMGLP